MDNLIFGYTWEEIQNAQQKGYLGRHISNKDLPCSQSDIDLLNLHGLEGLKEKNFYGVIDRLTRADLIKQEGN